MPRQRKFTLAPIPNDDETDTIKNTTDEKKTITVDSNHLTEESSLDDYVSSAEDNSTMEIAEKDIEIDGLREEIARLKSKIDELMGFNSRLLKENGDLKERINSNEEYEKLAVKCKGLETENENLILKNSELGMSMSIFKATTERMQNEIDSMRHTYTPNRYDNRKMSNGKGCFVPSMNGYQEWR